MYHKKQIFRLFAFVSQNCRKFCIFISLHKLLPNYSISTNAACNLTKRRIKFVIRVFFAFFFSFRKTLRIPFYKLIRLKEWKSFGKKNINRKKRYISFKFQFEINSRPDSTHARILDLRIVHIP